MCLIYATLRWHTRLKEDIYHKTVIPTERLAREGKGQVERSEIYPLFFLFPSSCFPLEFRLRAVKSMVIKKSYIIYILYLLSELCFFFFSTSLRPPKGEGEVFEKTKTTKASQNIYYNLSRWDFLFLYID